MVLGPCTFLIQNTLQNNTDTRAGIILIYQDPKSGHKKVLLVKAYGKLGFPKGYAEIVCSKCHAIQEYPKHKKPNFLLNKPPSQCTHNFRTETIWECATRELLEETGVDLEKLQYEVRFYQSIVGKKKPSLGCTYIVVEINQQPQIKIDNDEIMEYCWLPMDYLVQDSHEYFYHYNMGVRKMTPFLPTIYEILRSQRVTIPAKAPPEAQVQLRAQAPIQTQYNLWRTDNCIDFRMDEFLTI